MECNQCNSFILEYFVCKHNINYVYVTLFYYFRNGEKLAKYNEPRTFAELHEFVKRMRQNVAEEDDESVAVLDRDNFEDRTSEVEWTFILFHADWCRHCKLMADTWEKLAEVYKG